MKKSVIELFEDLIKIPHCSGETHEMRRYLVRFARECGYEVATDSVGNIGVYHPDARVTLQSHYDMVCIGRAPAVERVTEGGWMRAVGSSLGADNGMGIAMTLKLLQQRAPIDALFTNDEEIGLIGAGAMELAIRTPYLLNLDSEELGKVYIGCAGGEDLFASRAVETVGAPEGGAWYRLVATAPGGHSGVNIADGLPNAVSELARFIVEHEEMEVASMRGGERINAIPRRAEAVVRMPEGRVPAASASVTAEPAWARSRIVKEGRAIARELFGFAHGVRAWNRELDLPQNSINLATVAMDAVRCEIALSARSMANDELARLVEQTAAGWEACGFECRREGKYPAWKPEVNDFSEKVLAAYKKAVPEASYAAIHAGLECALFAERFPGLKIASVGPTILDPHSDRERVDLASVETVMAVIEAVVADLSAL